MKKVYVVLFFVLASFPFSSMLGNGDQIYWDAMKQITWKDFKKDEPKTGKHKVKSALGILILPEQKDDQTMIANVYAAFNKENSARPDADGQTDDALHHEQTRFDLAEVHARMERKQLPDSTYKTIGKFYIIAQRINKQANKDFMDESAKYDDETKMGTDAAGQKKWDQYVQDQLTKYSSYTSDDKIELPIEKKITPVK